MTHESARARQTCSCVQPASPGDDGHAAAHTTAAYPTHQEQVILHNEVSIARNTLDEVLRRRRLAMLQLDLQHLKRATKQDIFASSRAVAFRGAQDCKHHAEHRPSSRHIPHTQSNDPAKQTPHPTASNSLHANQSTAPPASHRSPSEPTRCAPGPCPPIARRAGTPACRRGDPARSTSGDDWRRRAAQRPTATAPRRARGPYAPHGG